MKAMQKQKERSELGKTERFRFVTTRSMSREEITAPWGDNALFGTIWVLRHYTRFKQRTYEEIGDIIGWRWRSIKNQFTTLFSSCFARHIIKEVRYSGGKERKFLRLDKAYHNFSFEQLVQIFIDSHYAKKYGPNNPETIVLEFLKEIDPKNWDYTGDTLACNKIGKCYPDFTHKGQKHVIEHFGIFHHGEDRTGEPNDEHEKNKINYYKRLGIKCLIIWEHELKDRDKLKKKIERFCNAI